MSYLIRNGNIFEQLIDEFDGGMTNAIRTKDTRFARFLANLDVVSTKNAAILLPGMTAETFDTGLTAAGTRISKYIAANDFQYALGVVSGQDYAKVFEKSSVAGSWAASSTAESASGTRSETLFVEYQGSLYGARNGTAIWRWNYGTNVFTEADRTLATAYRTTTPNQTAINPIVGVRFKKDDILYIGYDNILIRKNASTWTDPVLTFPTDEIISDLAEYGNYLAISTKPRFRGGRSNLYLWDQDSSLVTLSEKADWGSESLQLIEEIDGYIIGISTTAFAGVNNLDTKIIFKSYVNGTAGTKKLLEIPISSLTINFAGKQKQNNRFYFMMSCLTKNVFGTSTQRDGVWSFGRLGDGNFALSLNTTLNNDTVITTPVPKGFQLYGDWLHVAYTDNGTYVVNRNPNSSPYASGTGIYETPLLNMGDSDLTKKLIGATVLFEPLPTSSTVVLRYKVNAETSYTTIFSYTTADGISHGAINVESSGVNLPEFKEIQFRIQVSGAAIILTGMKLKAALIDKTLY